MLQFAFDAKAKAEIAADAGLELGVLEISNFSSGVIEACYALIDTSP